MALPIFIFETCPRCFLETDYEAAVFRETGGTEELLARLDGKAYAWRPFYEPFGGDRYLLGPEYDEQVPAGLAALFF